MAVIPINLARVSENLRAFNLLETLRRNQAGLFRAQNQLATGLRVQQPSDDPLAAASAERLDRKLDLAEQLQRNLLHANNALGAGESAMQDAVSQLTEMRTIALQAAGDSLSTDERKALAPLVDSALDQLIAIGNRQYVGSYLFAGNVDQQPFEWSDAGVLYRGDLGQSATLVDTDMTAEAFTLSGAEFFAAVSTAVHGIADLNPALTAHTRIRDLRGTTGNGVSLGRIAVSDGTQQTEIDLSGADTAGDLVDQLNVGLPPTLRAALTGSGITISTLGGPVPVSIRDLGGGQTARDLGLAVQNLTGPVGGADLDPRLTQQTALSDLNGGAGLNMAGGLTIRNGDKSVTLDFAGAQTFEDVLNTINQADIGVWARIAPDGRALEVLNRVSGSDLSIEENGGQLASALGIRSLHAGNTLAELNDGRGVGTVAGADLHVTTADGSSFELDLDGARTLQDVIDRLNAAGGGAITAGLARSGNGLSITDNTAGAGTLRVERANLSPALDDLGLNVPAVGNTLTGRDVNPVRVDNGLTALMELRSALRQDDRTVITLAGQRLENALERMQEVQGRMASHAQAMDKRTGQLDDEVSATQVLLSGVRDADIAETVVRFQQMQTALQANLTTATRMMNLSLMNFLG